MHYNKDTHKLKAQKVTGTYKVRNERNETKRNHQKRNETKRNQRNQRKQNEID